MMMMMIEIGWERERGRVSIEDDAVGVIEEEEELEGREDGGERGRVNRR